MIDENHLVGIGFWIDGVAVAKQSFRYAKGGGYRDPRVTIWEEKVAYAAKEKLAGREMMAGELSVQLRFYMPNRRRVDVDNLSKGVLDALKDVLFTDDSQVVELHVKKYIDPQKPRVYVSVSNY
jgi:Holliday junction resolvase RusA-like endonuclease